MHVVFLLHSLLSEFGQNLTLPLCRMKAAGFTEYEDYSKKAFEEHFEKISPFFVKAAFRFLGKTCLEFTEYPANLAESLLYLWLSLGWYIVLK
jgi:hypothetical protein